MAKRNIYLDTETSGLEPSTGHALLSLAAIVELGSKPPYTEVSEFSILVRPTEAQWQNASHEALKVNGLTWEKLQAEGRPLNEAIDEFGRWLVSIPGLSKSVDVVCQNPAFDMKFLRAAMGAQLDMIGFPFKNTIDIRDLYSILVNRRVMPYLKYRSGKNISQALGVEPEPDVHTAIEGARVVHRNYLKLIELGARS